MTCPTCHTIAARIRTTAEPDADRHYYACASGHRFTTVETVTTQAHVDRRQRERLWRQFEEIAAELRRVEG